MEVIGNVTGINRLRIDTDGPGVTTLVGLHGCELDCKYCINAKSPPPIRYTVSRLYDVVKRDRLYFDNTGGGVCFGGHEPLMQQQFIMDFIDYVRAQGDTWKIGIETSFNFPVYPQDLIDKLDYIICDVKDTNTDIYKAYTGQDNYYTMAISVMEARRNGYLMNYKGCIFATLDGKEIKSDISTCDTALNQRVIPTDTAEVRLFCTDGNTLNLTFEEYCLAVLAGEVRSTDFDGVVRQAQAIAIKTFTWHYLIIPHGGVQGYDLNDKQQSYMPSKVSENPKVTEDYNAVKNVWMESDDGALWLYDNGVATTYKALLKYYYDNSSASDTGAIRFFDSNKNVIY